MKKTLLYIAALVLGSTAMTSCDDDLERPPMVVPEATIEANTSIAQLKADFYTSEFNYATQIGTRADGSHYIIKGRVTSSDQAGNFFKQLVIDDGTSGIQINIDSYDIYEAYQFGQEVVIDVTDLYIGGYGKLMQIGAAPTDKTYPSRISKTVIGEKAQVNGLAEPGKIETHKMTIAELNNLKTNQSEWLDWQCRMVAIENVTFADAGKATLAESGKNTSRTISDGTGSLILYTSGYSDFWDYYCPSGTGTVYGVLSFYNNDWQIRLNDIECLQGYELSKEPSEGPTPPNPGQVTGDGSEEKPFTVADIQGGATGADVWAKGYIVGWVEGQVLAEGAHFDANATVVSNILVAGSADVTDVAKCIPVQLPSGTDARTKLNLKDNPGVLKKEVMLKGTIDKYFGVTGLKTISDFKIDGVPDTPDTPAEAVSSINENFDANTSVPAGWTQVQVAGNKSWYVTTFQDNDYIAMTGYKGTAPFDQYLLTPPVDMSKVTTKTLTFDTQVNGYSSKTSVLEVYVLDGPDVATANKTKLNPTLATAPDSGYSSWASSGSIDLSKFTGTIYIAFRYAATQDANYATWCVDNVKLNAN